MTTKRSGYVVLDIALPSQINIPVGALDPTKGTIAPIGKFELPKPARVFMLLLVVGSVEVSAVFNPVNFGIETLTF